MDIEIVTTPKAPQSYGPYSQATRAGGFIFCAGQGGFEEILGKFPAGLALR